MCIETGKLTVSLIPFLKKTIIIPYNELSRVSAVSEQEFFQENRTVCPKCGSFVAVKGMNNDYMSPAGMAH